MEFTGSISDTSSGLYYMNARYYNPKTGRFLTQDAMGADAWTNNLYSYCGNNPVNFKDPTGYRLEEGSGAGDAPITTPPTPIPDPQDEIEEARRESREARKNDAARRAAAQGGNNGGVTQTSGTTDNFLDPDDITRTDDGGFLTSDDAALYFLLLNQGLSQHDLKEYGAVIYYNRINNSYFLGRTHIGSKGDVIGIWVEATTYPEDPIGTVRVVGTVHTHTQCGVCVYPPENYCCGLSGSSMDGRLAGDDWLPGTRYLGAPNGVLYKSNINGPNTIVYTHLPVSPTSYTVDNNKYANGGVPPTNPKDGLPWPNHY